MSVKQIPDGYNTVTAYLIVSNAEVAIEFYTAAFDALEKARMLMPDGKIGHAEFRIGDSMVMLSNANPEWGFQAPEHYGGSPVSLFLYVEDVDAFFSKAIAAGAKEQQAPQNMFWGDRIAKLEDPFGYTWTVATHVEDVSIEESQKRLYQEYSK